MPRDWFRTSMRDYISPIFNLMSGIYIPPLLICINAQPMLTKVATIDGDLKIVFCVLNSQLSKVSCRAML